MEGAQRRDEPEETRVRSGLFGVNGNAKEVAIVPLSASKKSASQRPLRGKVALIVGGASDNGRSLAVAFAERGIDVAVVYFNEKHEIAREIKEQVEEHGQRCLLLSGHEKEDEESETFSQRVMQKILEKFGRLDIFINFSAQVFPFRRVVEEETERQEDVRSQIFPHFRMMKAALEEIVD
jgi:NAD(P)-dependent dehydrogenase (short-subunit alcohol dehydrogenase family)